MIFYKRLNCYRVLLEWLKSISSNGELSVVTNSVLYELVRCKDRNRLTPLQLLDNDFKDLIWIPDYIDDKQINFTYRFDDIDKHNMNIVKEATNSNGLGGVGNIGENKIKIRNITQFYNWWDSRRGGSDIYVFGSNMNNNLGVGDSTDRQIPCKLPIQNFKLDDDLLHNPRFKSIKISKNHSIIVTQDGIAYSCGIGSRGRLGHGDLTNIYRFKQINDLPHVRDLSISQDHSIANCDGDIYGWGLNNFGQLGFLSTNNTVKLGKDFNDDFESKPQLIYSGDLKKNSNAIKGIEVSKIHSLAYTKNDIFFWGLNIGQMGFNTEGNIEYKFNGITYKGAIQGQSRKITLRDDIKLVATCESITCVITTSNDIHIYSQGQHIKLPKIPIRGSLDRNFHKFSPVKTTKQANIVKVVMKSGENVGLLLDSGDVMGFNATDTRNIKYSSIWKSHDSDLRATDIDISLDGSIVLTTSTGLVFMKNSQSTKIRKNSMSETSLPIPVKNKFRRVDFINKIGKVATNDTFTTFGFIRDDIDLIPLKVPQNTFRKDMEYLSCVIPVDYYRKQHQLFDSSTNGTYTSDYIYSTQAEEEAEESDEEEEEDEKVLQLDPLFIRHTNKYSNNNKRIRTRDTFEQLDVEYFKTLVRKDDLCLADEKSYDGKITFTDDDTEIPFHSLIFEARSSVTRGLKQDEYLEYEGASARIIQKGWQFSNIDVRSAIIFIHFIYTNKIIAIWENEEAKTVKDDFEKLVKMFKMSDLFGTVTKDETYFDQLRSIHDISGNKIGDDTFTVKLSDGELVCVKSILVARSAFFETTLSQRWNTSELSFNWSVLEFSVVLRHLYGFSDFTVFEPLVENSSTVDDLINSLLDLISISDELLLFSLKNLCELLLKDFITIDNVVILLIHADNLLANKLFLNCCWYIYNNLEVLLLDQSLLTIPMETWMKLEANIRRLNGCKNKNNEQGYDESEWLVSKSIILVNDFINNMEHYNHNFMISGRNSFEPVIDVKIDGPPKDKRRKSRKSSSSEKPDIKELRAKATMANESAIEDTSEDNIEVKESSNSFEVVTRRRRKVEFEKKSPSPPVSVPPVIVQPFNNGLKSRRSSSSSANSSFSSINDNSFPVLGKAKSPTPSSSGATSATPLIQNVLGNGLSPHSNWASKSTAAPVFDIRPSSSSTAGITVKLEDLEIKKKKIGPNFKLPQRERKKLINNEDFQWGVPRPAVISPSTPATGPSSSTILPVNGSTTKRVEGNFPTLGKKKSPPPQPRKKSIPIAPETRINPTPKSTSPVPITTGSSGTNPNNSSGLGLTLTDIMIQESLKIEESRQKENERKSFQEIQQEQEFDRWWQEESRRVQEQELRRAQEDAKKRKPRKRSK
ncbi:hypothetical protein CLIB1444_01S06678 [[Candida] jaroonii]|uniref:Uncharacterized protein n=1 Tax=[Candida] jaroonii TaxID=467808 RepID=A0ACA9Y276_9ASCO|nr:hypothetical protein CLIB1444_01S06678 [[Candida] jaroonii]